MEEEPLQAPPEAGQIHDDNSFMDGPPFDDLEVAGVDVGLDPLLDDLKVAGVDFNLSMDGLFDALKVAGVETVDASLDPLDLEFDVLFADDAMTVDASDDFVPMETKAVAEKPELATTNSMGVFNFPRVPLPMPPTMMALAPGTMRDSRVQTSDFFCGPYDSTPSSYDSRGGSFESVTSLSSSASASASATASTSSSEGSRSSDSGAGTDSDSDLVPSRSPSLGPEPWPTWPTLLLNHMPFDYSRVPPPPLVAVSSPGTVALEAAHAADNLLLPGRGSPGGALEVGGWTHSGQGEGKAEAKAKAKAKAKVKAKPKSAGSSAKRAKAKKPGSKKAGASASTTSTGEAKKKRSSSVMQDVAVHGLPKVMEALVYMLRAVATKMNLNAAGRRDWAGLCEALKNDPEVPELFKGKLTLAFKNMVKNWLRERRKRASARPYGDMSVVDMHNALRAKMANVFGDRFVNVLGGYLASLRSKGKAPKGKAPKGKAPKVKAPGFVLEWPNHVRRVVVGKMVQLHRTRYHGLGLHRLHNDFFLELFSPGEVELAVLATCDCNDCVRAWPFSNRVTYLLDAIDEDVQVQDQGAGQGERATAGRLPLEGPMEGPMLTSRLDRLRFEWTTQKADLMAAIVDAHNLLGSHMYARLADTQPKLKNWSDIDMDYLLHQVHPAKSCNICKDRLQISAKKQKRGGPATDAYPLPDELSFESQCGLLVGVAPEVVHPTVDGEADLANQLSNLALL